jgi:hypothetical protein
MWPVFAAWGPVCVAVATIQQGEAVVAKKTSTATVKAKEKGKGKVKKHDPLDDIDFEAMEAPIAGQRLYVLGFDRYVQHDGTSEMPKELKAVVDARKGEMPPYMPLPKGPVTFRLGGEFGNGRRVQWDGKEKLPDPVLRYVRENGTLPRYSEEENENLEEEQ